MISPEVLSLRQRIADQESAPVEKLHQTRRGISPRLLLGGTFATLIVIGTLLLLSPLAQATGRWAWQIPGEPFSLQFFFSVLLNNFFMSTSASCITGLAVVEVSSYYSLFGQIVLLVLIQLGGLGIMTLGSFFMVLTGIKLSARDESTMMVSYGTERIADVKTIVIKTMEFVFFFEIIGAILLYCRYYFVYAYPPLKAIGYSIFHSVGAFCNAGMSLHAGNLISMQNDAIYLMTVASLVIFGGLGFLVMTNLSQIRFWKRDLRKRGRLSLHSLIVLRMTFWLLLFGTLLFALFEWNHSLNVTATKVHLFDAMLNGSWSEVWTEFQEFGHKMLLSFFHAVTPRTCGYNAVSVTEMSQAGDFLTCILMLIGGAPGSMAGGLKITTVVVVFLTMRAMLRGRQESETGARTIPFTIVREATVIVFVYLLLIFLTYFILLWTEDKIVAKGGVGLLFEIISAYGTVGLSLNNTADLSTVGKLVISFAMFAGRLGPITLAFMIASREISQRIRYPEASITVG